MSLCRRCALNGDEREGGSLGVCKIHAKMRCRFYDCGTKTLGEEFCAAHAHQAEIQRWTARANLRVIEPAGDFAQTEIRREKLMQAKFLAHEAVEIFFRSLLEATQGLYGATPSIDEERKAA